MSAAPRFDLRSASCIVLAALTFLQITAAYTGAYDLGTAVADMRQGVSLSGGTSCPQLTRFSVASPRSINRRWSTSLGANPVTILTADQTFIGRLNEIQAVIQQSLAAWTGVSGTALAPSALSAVQQTSLIEGCNSADGINSICFDQTDPGFALGVLAFTRVVSADTVGEQLSPSSAPAAFVGQILDADVLVLPGSASATFATPAALPANPNAYDLESILIHELGHSFGFNHSGVWGAMMFPFAPPPGQITGVRPTTQSPDAPLSDDDRTGLRVLYPSAADTTHVGAISGHVLPANSLALPLSPPGVTGIFPAQVVALDDATGNVSAAVLAGWSCADPGPPQFDGSYSLQRLTVGPSQSYTLYAEPLDGPVVLGNVIYNFTSLCRNAATDTGWPQQFSCTVPPPSPPFAARVKPDP